MTTFSRQCCFFFVFFFFLLLCRRVLEISQPDGRGIGVWSLTSRTRPTTSTRCGSCYCRSRYARPSLKTKLALYQGSSNSSHAVDTVLISTGSTDEPYSISHACILPINCKRWVKPRHAILRRTWGQTTFPKDRHQPAPEPMLSGPQVASP